MFTIDQIKTAHGKVKSGADFPHYIQEINALGVTWYEAHVFDGHVIYHGANNFTAQAPAKYDPIEIVPSPNLDEFKAGLLAHQQGKTDYLAFIKMCAECGIEKWVVSIEEMTCTYYDKEGAEVLVEEVPGKEE